MKTVLKSLADYVFSFGMFMFLLCAGFAVIMVALSNESTRTRELTQQRTAACYSQGLVLVSTDAGPRCADPRTLVKVK